MRPTALLATALIALSLALASCGGGGGSPEDPADSLRTLSEGDVAPDISLANATGGTTSLQDFRGEKGVLLYFSMGSG